MISEYRFRELISDIEWFAQNVLHLTEIYTSIPYVPNVRKQSDVGMWGHKTLIFEEKGKFS